MKDIQLIDIDYTGKNSEYKKEDIVDVSKVSSPWIIPEEGPFYADSLRVLKGGMDIEVEKFKAVEDVTNLTELTGRRVSLYIELADDVLASQGELTVLYQRVGKPVISVKTLLQMLEDMIITGKPIDWDTQVANKAKTYYPAQHSHDIQNPNELVGFGGLVELFTLFTNTQIQNSSRIVGLLEKLQSDMYNRLNYIQKLKWGAIMDHARNYNNPHGLLPNDVDAGNLSNYATATPQQDSEGKRADLYSTPAGLKRLITEVQPVTENYILQSELPFGYYGSGIYLPPPITGSFEGLGGDTENSAFNLEGNGWLVGLFRAFDGRVKNLYYMYKTDYQDRDTNRTPWLNTYVQYQHPTIQAAGKTANMVIDGSDGNVLMLGDQQNPSATITGSGNWWICTSNSTFDPNSHNLKPVNVDPIIQTLTDLTGTSCRASKFKLAYVGDWVYLLATVDSAQGDDPNNWSDSFDRQNWQTVMFRFPYKDLLDNTKSSITFTQINCTYDTLWRERRTNKAGFIPQRFVFTDSTKTRATEMTTKYSLPISASYINRKKAWVIVPNPNNPRLARVKLIISPYTTYTDPATGGQRSFGGAVCINYDWDVVSNIWTISPNWSMPTVNMDVGGFVNLTQQQSDYSLAGQLEGLAVGFVNTTGSWVPGYGFICLRSAQTGTPPYMVTSAQFNRDGNMERDYEYMSYPNYYNTGSGQLSVWTAPFKMRSPFGVAGFPRLYGDLYSLTTGMRQSPIEIFVAENEEQTQRIFYRISEGGSDDGYNKRDSLQSAFITQPIYGRKTNSSFGLVDGLTMNIGYVNRPKRKNATTRGTGLFSWCRRAVHLNSGAPYDFTWTTDANGNVAKHVMQPDGSIILNLDLDYTLDTASKKLYARPNKAKQVRIPKSFYIDAVYAAMGSHANEIIDIAADFYIGLLPGTGGDQPYSFWSVTYHVKSSPAATRMIIGVFTWDVASTGADGIRVLKTVGMNYPFKALQFGTNAELKPGNPNNIVVNGRHTLASNLTWNLQYQTGLQVRQAHVEILDFESEGNQNMEIAWFPSTQLQIVGNSDCSRMVFRRRNGQITEAVVGWRQGQAFNEEYCWQLTANAQWGWLAGVSGAVSGAAMDLMQPWDGRTDLYFPPADKYIMYGATYVEGNWTLFINSDVLTTFNGYAMTAKQTNWDLRDLTDVYRSQKFYVYCIMDGSSAFYEVTKTLRNHNSAHVLVAIVTTDDFGIVTIERRQSFTISGFPLTRVRDMGVPASSGAITDIGTYRFLNRNELYDN